MHLSQVIQPHSRGRRVCAQRPLKPLGGSGTGLLPCRKVPPVRLPLYGARWRIVGRLARKALAPHHILGPAHGTPGWQRGQSRARPAAATRRSVAGMAGGVEVSCGACDG